MTVATLILSLLACGSGTSDHAATPDPHGHEADHGKKAGKSKADPGAKAPAAAPAPVQGKVAFVEPTDGAKVKGKFTVKFAVEGMTVHPAGQIVPNTGHHHLIIDGGPIPAGTVIPMDDKHLHFGKGQTETEIELPPGEHKLTMQFADGAHVSYGETMAATITVVAE